MSQRDAENRPAPDGADGRVKCDEIQAVLFDYMSRELGAARSELVRAHLRRCPACQAAAAEIQATLDLLRRASGAAGAAPARLSEERRRRILWALAHPALHWIERHHILSSLLAAVLALALVMLVLRGLRLQRGIPSDGVPVNIGAPPAAGGPGR